MQVDPNLITILAAALDVADYRSEPVQVTTLTAKRILDVLRSAANRERPPIRAQLEPYNDHPPAVKGSDTSEAAARSIKRKSAFLRGQVLEAIALSGSQGCTTDECERLLSLTHQTCSPRVVELRDKGLIIDSGQRRKTRSGRKAVVYVLVKGQRELAL